MKHKKLLKDEIKFYKQIIKEMLKNGDMEAYFFYSGYLSSLKDQLKELK